jgi:hypothetical protein
MLRQPSLVRNHISREIALREFCRDTGQRVQNVGWRTHSDSARFILVANVEANLLDDGIDRYFGISQFSSRRGSEGSPKDASWR